MCNKRNEIRAHTLLEWEMRFVMTTPTQAILRSALRQFAAGVVVAVVAVAVPAAAVTVTVLLVRGAVSDALVVQAVAEATHATLSLVMMIY